MGCTSSAQSSAVAGVEPKAFVPQAMPSKDMDDVVCESEVCVHQMLPEPAQPILSSTIELEKGDHESILRSDPNIVERTTLNEAQHSSNESPMHVVEDEFLNVSENDKTVVLECRAKIAGFMGIPQHRFTDADIALPGDIAYFNGKWKVKFDKAPTVISVAEVPGSIWLILKAETVLECDKHDLVALILNDYRFEEYDEYSAISEVH